LSPSKPLPPYKRAASPDESSSEDPEDDEGPIYRELNDGPSTLYKGSKWSPDNMDRIWIPEVYVRYDGLTQ
jgi:hypothetical protein